MTHIAFLPIFFMLYVWMVSSGVTFVQFGASNSQTDLVFLDAAKAQLEFHFHNVEGT